jgi:hypothetical protein
METEISERLNSSQSYALKLQVYDAPIIKYHELIDAS